MLSRTILVALLAIQPLVQAGPFETCASDCKPAAQAIGAWKPNEPCPATTKDLIQKCYDCIKGAGADANTLAAQQYRIDLCAKSLGDSVPSSDGAFSVSASGSDMASSSGAEQTTATVADAVSSADATSAATDAASTPTTPVSPLSGPTGVASSDTSAPAASAKASSVSPPW
ncbi:uncharacterized protein LOC62_02G002655 [Vanrija pseudolonga]|uniref:Extracellular membrane protein CFEM domain-containing protein n=1 Tax=Vanrija pseudolonga TaxID=143232 RepID=A0AAF0Y6Q4_9TREE|nr:hypothetical protein LOC62_02G002655 [Vanrija pseudolonga]